MSNIFVQVNDSQALRNMGIWHGSGSSSALIQEYILSLQLGFSCNAFCNHWENLWLRAIIWNNCSEGSEACNCIKILPFYLAQSLDSIYVSSQHLYHVQVLPRLSTRASSLEIALPPKLTFSACFSRASAMNTSRKNVNTLALLQLLFRTICPCCHSPELPCSRVAQWWYCASLWLSIWLQAILCQRLCFK